MDKKLFENNPNLKEYFETSDGEKFYKEDLAKNHARTFALKDATIKVVFRPEEKDAATLFIESVATMDQETVLKHFEAESDSDEPNEEFLEALSNRNTQLQAINSANSSAAEFQNEHATTNVVHQDDVVVSDHAVGAPFKIVDDADAAKSEMNSVNAPLVIKTDAPVSKAKSRAKTK